MLDYLVYAKMCLLILGWGSDDLNTILLGDKAKCGILSVFV